LNPALNFDFFIKRFYYGTYEMGVLGRLADNGLSSCIPVVGANSRKGGHTGGDQCTSDWQERPVREIIMSVASVGSGSLVKDLTK